MEATPTQIEKEVQSAQYEMKIKEEIFKIMINFTFIRYLYYFKGSKFNIFSFL